MNYNIEQLNILFEQMQKDLQSVFGLSIIALFMCVCLFSVYEIRIEKK